MSTALEILKLSPLANEVDCAARYYVDRIDRDHYDGRMSSERACDLYRISVGATVHKRMLEELEPIHKATSRMMSMFLHPTPEIPQGLRDMMESVEKKWAAVFEELCGAPDKRVGMMSTGGTPPKDQP